jgi:uncharacterized membrane protein
MFSLSTAFFSTAFLKSFLTILMIMLLLDSVYLYFTKSIFGELVAKIQRTAMQLRIEGAIIVYLLLAIGLYYFIVKPGLSAWEAGLLGLVIYGTFDFTNYAMLKNYDLKTAIMDTVWGSLLFALTTVIVGKVYS